MGVKDEVTFRASFRLSPVQMGLFVLGPIALAVAQVMNSFVTGFPLYASAGFTVLMIVYAVWYTQYNLARLRLQHVEREVYSTTT